MPIYYGGNRVRMRRLAHLTDNIDVRAAMRVLQKNWGTSMKLEFASNTYDQYCLIYCSYFL